MGLLVALVAGMNGAQESVLHLKGHYPEDDIRWIVYRLGKDNPELYKRKEIQQDLDYYITIFDNNTKRLEEEITQHKSQKSIFSLNKNNQAGIAFLKGLAFTGLAVASVVCLEKGNYPRPTNAAGLGLVTFCSIGLAGVNFDEALHYEKNRTDELEREKPILAILQAEKVTQQANKI